MTTKNYKIRLGSVEIIITLTQKEPIDKALKTAHAVAGTLYLDDTDPIVQQITEAEADEQSLWLMRYNGAGRQIA